MFKLIAFFLLATLGMTIFNAVAAGGGGIEATPLTSAVNSTAVAIPVSDTTGFLNLDYITVDGEDILYVSKTATQFNVDANGRGYNGTAAASHASGALAYSNGANIVNQLSTYNVDQILNASGFFSFINFAPALAKLLINVVGVQFSFLGTDLAILTYIWGALVAAFFVTIAIYMVAGRTA